VVALRGVNYLLHARDKGSKGSNNDASFRFAKNPIESRVDYLFGGRPARTLSVRGIRQQSQNALLGELG